MRNVGRFIAVVMIIGLVRVILLGGSYALPTFWIVVACLYLFFDFKIQKKQEEEAEIEAIAERKRREDEEESKKKCDNGSVKYNTNDIYFNNQKGGDNKMTAEEMRQLSLQSQERIRQEKIKQEEEAKKDPLYSVPDKYKLFAREIFSQVNSSVEYYAKKGRTSIHGIFCRALGDDEINLFIEKIEMNQFMSYKPFEYIKEDDWRSFFGYPQKRIDNYAEEGRKYAELALKKQGYKNCVLKYVPYKEIQVEISNSIQSIFDLSPKPKYKTITTYNLHLDIQW